jgi:hypothetical protein
MQANAEQAPMADQGLTQTGAERLAVAFKSLPRFNYGYSSSGGDSRSLGPIPSIDGKFLRYDDVAEMVLRAAQGGIGEFPAMTPQLATILGTMCFDCIHFARALRMAGQDIKTRAEDEQAATLHWMLTHYFRHGENWRKHAVEDIERMRDAANNRAAQDQGGA